MKRDQVKKPNNGALSDGRAIRATGGEIVVRGPQGQMRRSFTLGRAAMSKINAVESIVLPAGVQDAFEKFDREDLSSEQRRAQLRSLLLGKTSS